MNKIPWRLSFFILASFFVFAHTASAKVVLEQNEYTTEMNFAFPTTQYFGINPSPLDGATGKLKQITLKVSTDWSVPNLYPDERFVLGFADENNNFYGSNWHYGREFANNYEEIRDVVFTFSGDSAIDLSVHKIRYLFIFSPDHSNNIAYRISVYGKPGENFAGNSFIRDSSGNVFKARLYIKIETDEAKTQVLFVPGLLGTEINKENDRLWLDLQRSVLDIGDEFMDDLQFKVDVSPINSGLNKTDVIKKETANLLLGKVTVFDYSESLVKEFDDQGYTENQDFFTFPYDWRYGASGLIYQQGATTTNSELLKKKIDDILDQTKSEKVDVIVHSTGGLLIKKYVMDHPLDNHVGKAVMVGVPNLGAPKAAQVLVEGDDFGVMGLDIKEMKKISQNIPVTYELAPNQTYANVNGSFYRVITDKWLNQPTFKDLSYTETWERLTQNFGANSKALTNSQNLQTPEFATFDMRTAGVDVYNIVGCKSGTIGKVKERDSINFNGNKYISFDQPDEIAGDGTVPFESADSIVADEYHRFYATKADHGKMPSLDGIRQQIVNIITGSNLTTGSSIITRQKLLENPKKCEIYGKHIKILSPLNIEVTDQNGKRLGFAEDGSLQKDIPGADFNVFGDHKFVFLPEGEGETYQINLKGTGQGNFTLGISNVDGGQVLGSINFVNLPVSSTTIGTLDLYAEQPTLNLDTDGNGTIDQTILPSSILDANESQDLIPPVSSSTLSGLMGKEGFFRSNVSLTLSAEDMVVPGHENETSGVLSIQYSLDGQGYQIYSTATPINITQEGTHEISFFVTDKAGNSEQPKTISFVIDKTAPEINFQFNLNSKDLEFTAIDALAATSSTVSILDNGDVITVKDSAGNQTILTLKDKNRKKALKAEIKSLSYNGQAADISKTALKFNWELDKTGGLKHLEQLVKSKKDFKIEAEYEKGITKLEGKDQSGKIKQILNDLVLLKVFTNKGDFDWGY